MTSEIAQLMEEQAGGPNNGRRASDAPNLDGDTLPLGAEARLSEEFMRDGGWTIVHAKDGSRAGVSSHGVNQYTVLHPDEHVDEHVVAQAVEDELGFTLEHLHSVYSTGGRIPSTRRELRDRIDARVLALSRSGANMDLFGRVTGLNPSTLDRALARAQAKEGN